MPIPDQTDNGYALGVPAAFGPQPLINRLRTGTSIHFVDSGGVHQPTLICNVANMQTGEISVNQIVNGRRTTLCNVPYDDQTKPPYSWHFPSDG